MERIYTLEEAKSLGDQAISSIDCGNVLVTAEGSRFVEVKGNMWMKLKSERSASSDTATQNDKADEAVPFDNILYVSASHHDGGVVVRPLYVLSDDQWVNILTKKKAVFASR